MDINSLKEFLTVAETQNFWEASELLFINESTLSKHIKKLESELQVPLFFRNTRKVVLTSYGEQLIPHAQQIISEEKKFLEELSMLVHSESQKLILGVIPSMVQYRITNILINFKREHPDKTVQILEGDTNELLEALIHRKCSMAFLRESHLHPIDSEIFEKIPYTKDRLSVLLPADHPKASQKYIPLKELQSEEFVILNHGTLIHQIILSLCHAEGFSPTIAMECRRMDSIFDLVAQHMGISILTDKHFNASLQKHQISDHNLRLVPLWPEQYSQTYLCFLKNTSLNTTAREMLECIKRNTDK